MDYFYNDIPRLDWGFGNPNTTAAFIAMLAVATIGGGLVWKKVFWIAMLVAAGLLVALIHTLSRGGMVAFLAGVVALLFAVRPKLGKFNAIAMAVIAVSLIAYAHHLGGASRYVQGVKGVEDRSVTNRWLIYRTIPRMLADAPDGWGNGNAAAAYHQWYQPEGRPEDYLNLVNSHFTWLVEWPTWARLSYLFGWVWIFLLTWPVGRHRWWGIAHAVFATFFVAACFSSVAHKLWIWPFPAVLFTIVLFCRLLQAENRPSSKLILRAAVVSCSAYGLILSLSWIPNKGPVIHHCDGMTLVGPPKAKARLALCGSDQAIIGKRAGHRIREFVSKNPEHSIAFFEVEKPIDASYQTLVLIGDAARRLESPQAVRSIFLLNPTNPSGTIDVKNKTIKVLWGEFNPSSSLYYWKGLAAKSPQITIQTLIGQGKYLESWLNEISYE